MQRKRWAILRLVAAGALFTWNSGVAQQTTGAPGSPGATTTIDGNYLPPPPLKFGGQIDLSARDSKPYWPPTVVPEGRKNVVRYVTCL
jgi:hypothetical protein